MFDIGWPELFLVAVVVLLVIGPKELPRVLANIARWVSKAKSVTREFRSHVDDMIRESELDDVKRQFDAAASGDVNAMIENTIDPDGELKKSIDFADPEVQDTFETEDDLDVYSIGDYDGMDDYADDIDEDRDSDAGEPEVLAETAPDPEPAPSSGSGKKESTAT
jgi:Tat protein translocase TatB subunit